MEETRNGGGAVVIDYREELLALIKKGIPKSELKVLRVGLANGGIAFVAIGCYLQFLVSETIASLSVSGFMLSGYIGLSILFFVLIL